MSKEDTFVKEQVDVAKRLNDLEKDNKDKAKEIQRLQTELGKATSLISGFNTEKDAADAQERSDLIHVIAHDSLGCLRVDQLSNLGLHDLKLIHRNFVVEQGRDYKAYFERRRNEELQGKRKSGMTVGEFDPKTKRYKNE